MDLVQYDSHSARLLVAELDQDMHERYGEKDETPVDPSQFDAPDGAFLVLTEADEPVACAGLRRLPGSEDCGELKRMWVRPEHRRRGHASAIIAAIETLAVERGYRRIQLETGTKQPESIALYQALGYRAVPAYGYYADDPQSRCYAKALSD